MGVTNYSSSKLKKIGSSLFYVFNILHKSRYDFYVSVFWFEKITEKSKNV